MACLREKQAKRKPISIMTNVRSSGIINKQLMPLNSCADVSIEMRGCPKPEKLTLGCVPMRVENKRSGESAAVYALRVLKNNIINVKLRPGDKLSEEEASKELQISRTPLREAILTLKRAHLIDIYPQRGTYIAHIDPLLVEQAMILSRAARRALNKKICSMDISFADQQTLWQNLKLQEHYFDIGDKDETMALSYEFASLQYQIAGYEQLYTTIELFDIHHARCRRLLFEEVKDKEFIERKKEILELTLQHDYERTLRKMDEYDALYPMRMEVLRQTYPGYFADGADLG